MKNGKNSYRLATVFLALGMAISYCFMIGAIARLLDGSLSVCAALALFAGYIVLYIRLYRRSSIPRELPAEKRRLPVYHILYLCCAVLFVRILLPIIALATGQYWIESVITALSAILIVVVTIYMFFRVVYLSKEIQSYLKSIEK